MAPPIILASTSRYRKQLLERLHIPFEQRAPDVDETAHPDESPEALTSRLSEAKARAVAVQCPDGLIIGSDQVATLDGAIIGKPGSHERAAEQLRRASGREVKFLTGLSLFNAAANRAHTEVVPFSVVFRPLTEARIQRYLRLDTPYDCAGSFKAEGLGPMLFEKMAGDDPTALMGLPLIRLIRLLEAEGVEAS